VFVVVSYTYSAVEAPHPFTKTLLPIVATAGSLHADVSGASVVQQPPGHKPLLELDALEELDALVELDVPLEEDALEVELLDVLELLVLDELVLLLLDVVVPLLEVLPVVVDVLPPVPVPPEPPHAVVATSNDPTTHRLICMFATVRAHVPHHNQALVASPGYLSWRPLCQNVFSHVRVTRGDSSRRGGKR
jgi:hypothetical protein